MQITYERQGVALQIQGGDSRRLPKESWDVCKYVCGDVLYWIEEPGCPSLEIWRCAIVYWMGVTAKTHGKYTTLGRQDSFHLKWV